MYKSLLIVLMLICAEFSNAGDYHLFLFDRSAKECERLKHFKKSHSLCSSNASWNACSMEIYAKDIENYLNGISDFKIPAVIASTTNGHLSFCSPQAFKKFQLNLDSLKGKVKNERHLNNFIGMYGNAF